MSNDLATEIIGRVRRLLGGLAVGLVWKRLPALPPLGQSLYTRYSKWIDGLFSKLHLPLASEPSFTQSSSRWLSPLSYAWFDRKWGDLKRRSRSFWRQSGSKEDEAIQSLPIPEHLSAEDVDEGVTKQSQSARSEPADDITLRAPTLRTLSPGYTEFRRTEQLAKAIGLRLELPTNKGAPVPRRTGSRQPEDLIRHIALRLELVTNEGSLVPWQAESARAEQLAKTIAPGLELLTNKGVPVPRRTEFGQLEDLIGHVAPGLELLTGKGSPAAWHTESARAEQLARNIALRLELLTNKGSPAPWHMPSDTRGVPYYPELAANSRLLLEKFKEIIASQRLTHLEETFRPSSPVDSSPPGLRLVSEQYIGTAPMPAPGEFSPADRLLTQAASRFAPVSDERTDFQFERSGALPVAPGGQPASEPRIAPLLHSSESPSSTSNSIAARKMFPRLEPSAVLRAAPGGQSANEREITSLLHLSESPPTKSNTIAARNVSPRLHSLATASLMASGGDLTRKALAASLPHLFQPPQVAAGAVPTGRVDKTPVSYSLEGLPLFRRDEAVAPEAALGNTRGSRQTSPLHWSAGHIPAGATEKPMGQEMGGPLTAIASTITNSPLGGYSRGMEAELALAPVGRQRENIPAATSSAASAGQEGALEAVGETMPALDSEALASEVYSIIKRRLVVEKERTA